MMPTVRHEYFSEESGIRYVVMAYRQLSHDELMRAMVGALAQTPQTKKPTRGMMFSIITTIGAEQRERGAD